MPKAEKDWKKVLTQEQYRVLREKGTEPAFTGKYYKTKDAGMYVCAACGNKLFSSKAKFESGTGWPSFSDPANLKNVILGEEDSSGMVRTEVLCAKCGSHLGHVFDDGPRTLPTGRQARGKRYCINSVCLELKKDKK